MGTPETNSEAVDESDNHRRRWSNRSATAKRLLRGSRQQAEDRDQLFSFKFSGVRPNTQSLDLKEESTITGLVESIFFVSKGFSCACIFAHAWIVSSFTWMASNMTGRDLTNSLLHPLRPHSPPTFLCAVISNSELERTSGVTCFYHMWNRQEKPDNFMWP